MVFLGPYLSLSLSFWPVLLSFSVFSLVLLFLMWMTLKVSLVYLLVSLVVLLLLMKSWWWDLFRESLVGFHTSKLEFSLRVGMVLFILSEVLFFVSFFWAFYDSSLSPVVEVGMAWPPKGILPLGVYSVPLLNTVILLSSGISITWSHHALLNNLYNSSVISLLLTVLLGVFFLKMQYEEYMESSFSIADGIYGSTFFMSTGFHGMHVIVGTCMLLWTLFGMLFGGLLFNHHFLFEASAWYWHFVDVVWLFLYISIYWWGGL